MAFRYWNYGFRIALLMASTVSIILRNTLVRFVKNAVLATYILMTIFRFLSLGTKRKS